MPKLVHSNIPNQSQPFFVFGRPQNWKAAVIPLSESRIGNKVLQAFPSVLPVRTNNFHIARNLVVVKINSSQAIAESVIPRRRFEGCPKDIDAWHRDMVVDLAR